MSFAKVFEEQINQLHTFDGYELRLGVFEGKTKRTKTVKLTNAELLFIHEHGSAVRHLPPRPVLMLTMQYLQSTLWPETRDYILKHIFENGWQEADIQKELKKMCIRLQTYARETVIGSGKMLAKLKYRKGIPLKDTGQLQRSIQCILLRYGNVV